MTKKAILAASLLCLLALTACGGAEDGDGGPGGTGGEDALTQKIYQGTQPSLGELDVGVRNIFDSGVQFSVTGHDPDAEAPEVFTAKEDESFTAGDYTFDVLAVGEDDEGDFAEVSITPSPKD